MPKSSKSIQIVEVGLRDGLQNEKTLLTKEQKLSLIHRLIESGAQRLELGAFVRTDRIPQMADSKEIIKSILDEKHKNIFVSALVPNEKGMQEALQIKTPEVAIFTAASDTFTKHNINCTVEESFERFEKVFELAKKNKVKVRGYLSTAFGCPYEGAVDEKRVVELTKRLIKSGCYEVSIGDTIGVAVPDQVRSLFKKLLKTIPAKKLAGHFHNTRGTALANIAAAHAVGITIFDSSIGGLGGCPYAPGAAGNVSTEDVVYFFEHSGIKTGLNLKKLVETNHWLSGEMKKTLPSSVGQAGVWP